MNMAVYAMPRLWASARVKKTILCPTTPILKIKLLPYLSDITVTGMFVIAAARNDN